MTRDHLSTSEYWSQRYQDGKTGWDMKKHHPFLPTMRSYLEPLKGKSVLVIGAGPGHDAEFFSHHGADVTAYDFSSEAKNLFHAYYPDSHVNYQQMDLFDCHKQTEKTFDIIIEHTLLCAIDPKRYPDYFKAIKELTHKDSIWAAIIWNNTGVEEGPPFSVSQHIVKNHLKDIDFNIHVERDIEPMAPNRNHEWFVLAKK